MGTYSDLLQENTKPEKKKIDRETEQKEPSVVTQRSERLHRPERPERVLKTPIEVSMKLQKREIRRHSFEIFIDQVTSLQELRLKRMKEGELKSMSSMVREALDEYIQKQQ